MVIALVVAAIADFALGVLFVAVSGMAIYGVNNTGGDVSAAVVVIGMILLCFSAPLLGIWAYKRLPGPATLAIAYSPLIIGALLLVLEPLFV